MARAKKKMKNKKTSIIICVSPHFYGQSLARLRAVSFSNRQELPAHYHLTHEGTVDSNSNTAQVSATALSVAVPGL